MLTVGALHKDFSTPSSGSRLIDPYDDELPSPINGIGLGYRRSVKPDILMDGGRQLFDARLGNTEPNAVLWARPIVIAPGQLGCDSWAKWRFESSVLYPRHEQCRSMDDPPCGPILRLALGTPGVGYPRYGKRELYPGDPEKRWLCMELRGVTPEMFSANILKTDGNGRTIKDIVARFLGYGAVDSFLLGGCTVECSNASRLWQLGGWRGACLFDPAPSCSYASPDWRWLTITLAWLSPIEPANRKYRKAHLWFDPPTSELAIGRQNVDWQTAKRGTVQHEILEGRETAVFEENGQMQIQVNCRADAKEFNGAVPYGLAVSLQVAEGVDIPIISTNPRQDQGRHQAIFILKQVAVAGSPKMNWHKALS